MRGLVAQEAMFAPVPFPILTVPATATTRAPEVEPVSDALAKGFAPETRVCCARLLGGSAGSVPRHRGVGDEPWPRGPL